MQQPRQEEETFVPTMGYSRGWAPLKPAISGSIFFTCVYGLYLRFAPSLRNMNQAERFGVIMSRCGIGAAVSFQLLYMAGYAWESTRASRIQQKNEVLFAQQRKAYYDGE
eukprot:GGOE01060795.1.p3 GENE.GGOE01060795.1~~GGOE01060795.1.p3  ORF type:complete len:110 (+),score=38.76 GGOE01060795.1:103-432(+)